MVLKLGDSLWSSGDLEPFVFANTVVNCTEASEDVKKNEILSCTTCSINVGSDRMLLVMHYRSGWHHYNLKRKVRGRSVISEEEYEEKLLNAKIVETSSSDSDDEVEYSFSGGVHTYFVHEEDVFSIFNAILLEGEAISRNVLMRPLDCTILLLSGGHFCGGIFKDNSLVAHKSFHRYTIRAKQGGMQSAADAKNGVTKKSAGAALRRYNEKLLKEEIQDFIREIKGQIDKCPLVFIRTPICNKTIPFTTRRPNIDELMRIWERLTVVSEYGKVDNFRATVEMEQGWTKKRKVLRKRVKKEKVVAQYTEDETDCGDVGSNIEQLDKKLKQTVLKLEEREDKQASCEKVESDFLSDKEKEAIYLSIRTNSLSDFHHLIDSNNNKHEKIINYLMSSRFSPEGSSFLHIAAQNGATDIIKELLEYGCDPCSKNTSGLVPYEVSSNRSVKRTFIDYRAANPSHVDWRKARVPELKVLSDEQICRETEKKRRQRERKKQREKERKQAEAVEKKENAAREAFLALSDREKRAVAAERRMGIFTQTLPQPLSENVDRCFQMLVNVICQRTQNLIRRYLGSNYLCLPRFISSTQQEHLDELCICVNDDDKAIRKASKRECHKVETMSLHRAFSVFLFTPDNKLLLQKRSKFKVTFPGVWTNSCCSHPLWTEIEMCEVKNIGIRRAAQRKLAQELGVFNVPLSEMHVMGRFIYKAIDKNGWGEHEMDYAIVVPNFDAHSVRINSDEVEMVKSVDRSELKKLIQSGEAISPWFSLFLSHRYLYVWWDNLKNLFNLKNLETINRLN
uniref:isopentenyl-diphosphate Delta-isomerase n=1 Tax=Syphacia muris TaxID=451379 RepID=A0A0N5AJ68_9BILA